MENKVDFITKNNPKIKEINELITYLCEDNIWINDSISRKMNNNRSHFQNVS